MNDNSKKPAPEPTTVPLRENRQRTNDGYRNFAEDGWSSNRSQTITLTHPAPPAPPPPPRKDDSK